jgi:hypothetical protein
MPARLTTYTRECYINVATCLQKKAYDTTNEIAIDAHKQLVRLIKFLSVNGHYKYSFCEMRTERSI